MTFDKLFGPATVIYLISVTVAALWWASNLTTRVTTLEHSTITAERITRLEAQVGVLADGTHEMKSTVNDLARELRASRAR
jgi:hypothetical protein